MAQHDPDLALVEASLAREMARTADLLARLQTDSRVDCGQLPAGALAYVLAQHLNAEPQRKLVVITPDAEQARAAERNLRFFLAADAEGRTVLSLEDDEFSPYVDVLPDRRLELDRLATLTHLACDLPWRALVIPAETAVRRMLPRAWLAQHTRVVRPLDEIDRDALIDELTQLGFARVPLVEDAGTFSARGFVLDVFPSWHLKPVRIEFDDRYVASLRTFDPEDQKPTIDIDELRIHPVREISQMPALIEDARRAARSLYDEHNVPTLRTKEWLEQLGNGAHVLGANVFLPYFYGELDDLFSYAPQDALLVVVDPTSTIEAMRAAHERARADLGARVSTSRPAPEIATHYIAPHETAECILQRRVLCAHRVSVLGGADASTATDLLAQPPAPPIQLDARDHHELSAALKRARAQGDRPLGPLVQQIEDWQEAGLRVHCVAHSHHQADRIVDLLRGRGLAAERGLPIGAGKPGSLSVQVGELRNGFVSTLERVAFLTEEEIFGTRTRSNRRGKGAPRGFKGLTDLGELHVGDFVVHAEHGVGKYLGLARKELALSAAERLQGGHAASIEVLLIEYAGGDKLFVPVTRVGVIQKYASKEGHKPRIDRLGGITFENKKGKVRKAVRQMAEELLKLYAEREAARREPIGPAGAEYAEFEATFPFDETRDQASAIDDVLDDLQGERPMDRLVCGDVGFGKTEVAMRAAFRVALCGRQVALLCPTTVLAQQHYQTFLGRFEDYPINVRMLSRFVPKAAQTDALAGLKGGTVDVVIGTHRLLSKDVHFHDLGLLIVDEEQRFGVAHKERIKRLRAEVDVLTLSATPIPRTLQLAVGGLRSLSLIKTAPADRRAVRTLVCRWDPQLIREAVQRELDRGGQVFFVHNRIEGLHARAQTLQELLPQARIAVAHGRMKAGPLERTMTKFVEGDYDILCSTAIVESGLDISRANTMIIDRADAMGLSQLYQLRGRVGRSRERAYCYLITPAPDEMSDESRSRMEALERFSELGAGFRVATLDMELRGAGDLLGAEQSGTASLVGFDMFVQMLHEAVAELRGEKITPNIDPEITIDLEHYLPDDYVEDVGLRLSLYRRFASCDDESAVRALATEMENRFGTPPEPARQLVRVMAIKPQLRVMRALGCEALARRVTLHLDATTPLNPAKILPLVTQDRARWSLSPDRKLTRRFDADQPGDAIDRVHALLEELKPCVGAPDEQQ